MARHRKSPVSRHPWRAGGQRSRHAEPRPCHVAGAMRRVVVTPTFAAGLGVVIAALLASQIGAPAFRVGMPRWKGQLCATVGCVPLRHQAGPASVTGGQRLRPSSLRGAGVTKAGRKGRPSAGRSPTPDVTYQTTASWRGGFQGMLTVAFPRGYQPGGWWLRFSYPSGVIERVWGPVQVRRQGKHTAVVAAPGAGRQPEAGREISVSFQVTGTAGRPGRCFFDRLPCGIH